VTLPLTGIVVVALEQAVSAPFATRQLADMGARVIKVERVGEGDFARYYDTEVRGMASHFVWVNRGKESLALDFKHPAGRAILDELIASADVVVQNLAPGTADGLGLSARQLTALGCLVDVSRAQRVGLDTSLIDERQPAWRAGGEHDFGTADHSDMLLS